MIDLEAWALHEGRVDYRREMPSRRARDIVAALLAGV
jgi:hypothetical protein